VGLVVVAGSRSSARGGEHPDDRLLWVNRGELDFGLLRELLEEALARELPVAAAARAGSRRALNSSRGGRGR
jgi:hypothetical protein